MYLAIGWHGWRNARDPSLKGAPKDGRTGRKKGRKGRKKGEQEEKREKRKKKGRKERRRRLKVTNKERGVSHGTWAHVIYSSRRPQAKFCQEPTVSYSYRPER